MPIARLKTVNLNYLQLQPETISAEGCKDIVMVHGLATNLAFWYHLTPRFTKTHRVTLFDLRGHGKSSLPESGYTPEIMAEDLKELLATLGIEKAHFIGHSFGSSVVLNLAINCCDRVESLILADARLKLFQPHQVVSNWENWPQLKSVLKKLDIDFDENETEAGYQLLTQIARLKIKTAKEELPDSKLLSQLFFQGGSKRTAKLWLKLLETTTAWQDFTSYQTINCDRLKDLQKPTLAIYGERSPNLETARGLTKIWPEVQLKFVPLAGHFFPLSQPEKFLTPAIDFIQLNNY